MMIRLLFLPLCVLAPCLLTFQAAVGEGLTEISGHIDYVHGEPTPTGLCFDPVPGLEFAVTGDYLADVNGIDFVGTGPAVTCAFFQPVFGIYARYTGAFTWQSPSGRSLSGEFVGIDLNPVPLGDPQVEFETLIFITFTDDAGEFAGAAFAKGVDLPFGGPTSPPGVFADFSGFLLGDVD